MKYAYYDALAIPAPGDVTFLSAGIPKKLLFETLSPDILAADSDFTAATGIDPVKRSSVQVAISPTPSISTV